MATLQQQITEKFFTKLAASGSVNGVKLAKLRDIMASGKKLKADDVVRILSSTTDDVLT